MTISIKCQRCGGTQVHSIEYLAVGHGKHANLNRIGEWMFCVDCKAVFMESPDQQPTERMNPDEGVQSK